MDMIEFRSFAKTFSGKIVHKNICFNVRKGECFGLIGGSGAGKSVILRSLIGLEKPDSGEIIVEGEDIAKKNERELIEIRKKVAYVFQNGALFDSMSVYDNLAYPLRAHTQLKEDAIQEKILDLLEEFGLRSSHQLFPGELSGGMQKRVGLARSIILKPKVVLYDEPTAGLDPYNTIKIQEMIANLKEKGVTSIFVTHDMPSAFAVCDRIGLIQEGQVKEVEDIEKIKSNRSGAIGQFINGRIA